ncbi:HPt (histidine-containing phosphotransfer) domain-containing protein [Rhodobacteraceae bacterium MBR-64]|jgi:HPt (histidine-containing phosphotransfer) domain-containing protein
MIDWEQVATLRAEVGPDDFREVVDLFLEEVEDIVARLSTAPDPKRYEQDLHFLKGSALNLGFRHLGTLCQIGETEAAAGRAGGVDIGAVVTCYHQSKAEFMARPDLFGPATAP